MTTAQLPSGATMVNTTKVLQQVTDYYLTKEKDNVQSVFTVGGFGFSGQGQNNGLAFISLKPWSERVGEENSVTAIIQRAMIALSSINKAVVFPFNLPRWLNWVPRQVLIWNCWTTVTWGTKTNPGAKRAVITGSAITESGHRGTPERPGRYADVQSERQRCES